MLWIPEPTKLCISKDLSELELDQLRVGLTYTDQKVEYKIQKLKKASWIPAEEKQSELARLQPLRKVCLLRDGGDHWWTYAGLSPYVSSKLGQTVENKVTYPASKLLPWSEIPKFSPYEYQRKAVEALIAGKHCAVQMATGLGKTFIIANVLKSLGLRAVVMTPATQISEQIYDDFVKWFGLKNVGCYFDGKKKLGKLITIANAQSLTRVEEGTSAWEFFQKAEVFCADESHRCPASTLEQVCHGLMAKAPYRFFFSATQTREDGCEILLDAITGPVVYEMTAREGVDGKYLAKPIFHVFDVPSNGDYQSRDVDRMTRHHLLYHPRVAAEVGKLVNTAHKAGMPCLVLIDEVEQFTKLLPYLRIKPAFAHGTLNEDNRPKVPVEYHDSDPGKLVREFNDGKLPLLVGTSCISTGTDVKAVKFLIYWQGGKSEIQVKQAVGRGTRIAPGKTTCNIVDFRPLPPDMDPDSEKSWAPTRHADVRISIYNEIYGPVSRIKLA